MALQMNLAVPPLSMTVSAYVRIEQIQHSRFSDGLQCLARCYQSSPGFPPAQPSFKDIEFSVPFDPNGGDPYAQGYVGAKALPQFADAIDC